MPRGFFRAVIQCVIPHLGMTGVLHTYTRTLDYYPHVHFIVPSGGIVTKDKTTHWKTPDENYLKRMPCYIALCKARSL